VTNAGEPYARWCGELFERLQTAFFAYWRNARLELEPPPQPLVAILFASHDEYAAYAERDAGPGLAATQGYYSVRTNRIVLSNLAGSSTGTAATSEAEVLRGVEASIANLVTVVHEATHQIAFNTGMHTRYADNPMWLTEGMAMFFEAPDIRSTAGWKTIGKVHPGRLQQFQQYLASGRPANSLTTLIESEERFRDPDQIGEAYAESWALTHFLIRKHRGEYQEYLRMIAAKPRLVWSTPAQRIAEFQQAFGENIDKLDAEFLRYMASLRVTR
jgi:hypothetical protein